MQAVLVMFRSDGDRRSFSVTRDMTVIGRREDCDLRIPLGEVSRKHCRLVRDGENLRLEDLGSSNGTYLNGQRVQEAVLNPGDSVQIGPVVFVLQINGYPVDEELAPVIAETSHHAAEPATTVTAPVAPTEAGEFEDLGTLEPLSGDDELGGLEALPMDEHGELGELGELEAPGETEAEMTPPPPAAPKKKSTPVAKAPVALEPLPLDESEPEISPLPLDEGEPLGELTEEHLSEGESLSLADDVLSEQAPSHVADEIAPEAHAEVAALREEPIAVPTHDEPHAEAPVATAEAHAEAPVEGLEELPLAQTEELEQLEGLSDDLAVGEHEHAAEPAPAMPEENRSAEILAEAPAHHDAEVALAEPHPDIADDDLLDMADVSLGEVGELPATDASPSPAHEPASVAEAAAGTEDDMNLDELFGDASSAGELESIPEMTEEEPHAMTSLVEPKHEETPQPLETVSATATAIAEEAPLQELHEEAPAEPVAAEMHAEHESESLELDELPELEELPDEGEVLAEASAEAGHEEELLRSDEHEELVEAHEELTEAHDAAPEPEPVATAAPVPPPMPARRPPMAPPAIQQLTEPALMANPFSGTQISAPMSSTVGLRAVPLAQKPPMAPAPQTMAPMPPAMPPRSAPVPPPMPARAASAPMASSMPMHAEPDDAHAHAHSNGEDHLKPLTADDELETLPEIGDLNEHHHEGGRIDEAHAHGESDGEADFDIASLPELGEDETLELLPEDDEPLGHGELDSHPHPHEHA